MVFRPYPKMLYQNPGTPEQKTLIVPDEAAEHRAKAQGWGGYLSKGLSVPDSDSITRKSGNYINREETTDRFEIERMMADVEPEADPEPKPRKRSRKETK
jgi:hypothetical protein